MLQVGNRYLHYTLYFCVYVNFFIKTFFFQKIYGSVVFNLVTELQRHQHHLTLERLHQLKKKTYSHWQSLHILSPHFTVLPSLAATDSLPEDLFWTFNLNGNI